jgi:molybdopterin converting factor small subunit
MVVTVKFIGALRQTTGKTQLKLTLTSDVSLKDLIFKIPSKNPQQKTSAADQLSKALVLVNGREISVLGGLDTRIHIGDEVVFITVVHGG